MSRLLGPVPFDLPREVLRFERPTGGPTGGNPLLRSPSAGRLPRAPRLISLWIPMDSVLLASPDQSIEAQARSVVEAAFGAGPTLERTPSLDPLVESAGGTSFTLVLVDERIGAGALEAALSAAPDRRPAPPVLALLQSAEGQKTRRWIRAGAEDGLLLSDLGPARMERAYRRGLARRDREVTSGPGHPFYRALVKNSLDIITVLDEEATIRYESPSVRALGYEPHELVGESVFAYVHEGDHETVAERFEEAIQEPGYTTTIEVRFRHKDGSWRTLESRAQTPGQDDVQGIVVNSRDITERKSVEQALRKSEAHTRALLHAMPDATARLSKDGTYLDVQLPSGYPSAADPDELEGASVQEVMPPDIAERAMASIERALDTGNTQQFEYSIDVEGTERYREVRMAPAQETEVLSVQRDITERKRSEQALRRSREQLRDLNTYLHSVREEERAHISREVHDALGQKLTSLRMDVTLLQRELSGNGADGRLDEMEDRLESTIQAVRRISSELRPPVLDDVGLGAAVRWESKQFESRSEIPCDVSVPADDLGLDPDLATDLFRLFQEALTNVARHAEASSVEVHLAHDGSELVLTVSDDGRGIREEEIDDAASLGLLGMRERAATWDGRVAFDAGAEEGTTVTVCIPHSSSEKTRPEDYD